MTSGRIVRPSAEIVSSYRAGSGRQMRNGCTQSVAKSVLARFLSASSGQRAFVLAMRHASRGSLHLCRPETQATLLQITKASVAADAEYLTSRSLGDIPSPFSLSLSISLLPASARAGRLRPLNFNLLPDVSAWMERERQTHICSINMHRFRRGTSERLQLPRIILKNNVFFNSASRDRSALADDRRPGVSLFFLAGRVCINL
jgi:hypothetical protein